MQAIQPDPGDEIVRLRAVEAAAIRVVQLVDHDSNVRVGGEAIAKLRRALREDGGQ